jgi:hypothetical protein
MTRWYRTIDDIDDLLDFQAYLRSQYAKPRKDRQFPNRITVTGEALHAIRESMTEVEDLKREILEHYKREQAERYERKLRMHRESNLSSGDSTKHLLGKTITDTSEITRETPRTIDEGDSTDCSLEARRKLVSAIYSLSTNYFIAEDSETLRILIFGDDDDNPWRYPPTY